MIDRPGALRRIRQVWRVHAVAALLGPRQCGKTTLARVLAQQQPSTYFDLESPRDRARLESPMRALGELSGLIVVDEFQRRPDLFEVLRVLVDRPGHRARFLVLGSASTALVKGASESLAGRMGFVDLSGFTLGEVGAQRVERLWLRGGFPRSFLARGENASLAWREDFIRTFLERDIPQLGITIPAETLRRFWSMIAHYHGQIWNAAEFARSLGTAEHTARRYLDILAGAYMVRILPPWFENLKKRQVKAPKIYVRDSGILHALLQVRSLRDLQGHPKFGASWEGFALEQVLDALNTRDAYYWATHAGAELDLLLFVRGRRYGFEFKASEAPPVSRSARSAIQDLRLEHLWIVYPGTHPYPAGDRVTAWPLRDLGALIGRLETGRQGPSARRTSPEGTGPGGNR